MADVAGARQRLITAAALASLAVGDDSHPAAGVWAIYSGY
jgi:hypothetical protein